MNKFIIRVADNFNFKIFGECMPVKGILKPDEKLRKDEFILETQMFLNEVKYLPFVIDVKKYNLR